MKSKSGKGCKDCPRCGKNLTSSAMSKYLKQVHGAAIAREQSAAAESAAASFARLVSKEPEKPEKEQPKKQLDDDEKAVEKPLTSIGALASAITEFIGTKFNELITQMGFQQEGMKQLKKDMHEMGMQRDVMAAIWGKLLRSMATSSAGWRSRTTQRRRWSIGTRRRLLSPVSCACQRLSCTVARIRAQRSATGALPSCTPTAAAKKPEIQFLVQLN